MPVSESQYMAYDGQNDFSGGMNALVENPRENQYTFGKNLEIRGGMAKTRRSVWRAWPQVGGGVLIGLYFNPDNLFEEVPGDPGLWFEDTVDSVDERIEFARSAFSDEVQAVAVVKGPKWPKARILYASDGACRVISDGYADTIPTADLLDPEETITLVQANQYVFMFRGEEKRPLVWDFGANGFVPVGSPSLIDDNDTPGDETDDLYWDACPFARLAVYFLGRLWAVLNDDEIAASDILAFTDWDLAQRRYAINYGDGQRITALVPFSKDIMFVCKDRSIHALTGLSTADLSGINRRMVDARHGLVAQDAYAIVGEDLWFLSYDGIYKVNRNQFDELQANPVAVSAPIESLIKRINQVAIGNSCAGVADNYVLFGVPVDGSDKINAILVYDLLLQTWVGIWQGTPINPRKFFTLDDRHLFLGEDGVVRQLFRDGFHDTLSGVDDAPEFKADGRYQPGEYVRVGGSAYLCRKRTPVWDGGVEVFKVPSVDLDYWQEIAETGELFSIEFELLTRPYTHTDPSSGKMISRGEVTFSHQDPSINIALVGPDPHDRIQLFDAPRTYPQAEYDVVDRTDWEDTNANQDFDYPHRKDYTFYLPASGFYLPSDGAYLNQWETHALRFFPRRTNDRNFRLSVSNSKGKVAIRSIAVQGNLKRFAARNR